jgi:hypothetical protein
MCRLATRFEEFRVFPRFAPTIGLLTAFAPVLVTAVASAQTNIDQGKSPAQIFSEACAGCHKATRGLANGKNNLTLSLFLREHYTASREQAAALAAYVLGAGGAEPAKPGQKPGQERAKNEEAKPAARPGRPTGKPEPEAPASAKLQRPNGEAAKPDQQVGRPVTATRGRKNGPETPPASPPAAVVSSPPASETTPPAEAPKSEPKQESRSEPRAEPGQDQSPTTSAAAPAESQSGDGAAVPRDNIPD